MEYIIELFSLLHSSVHQSLQPHPQLWTQPACFSDHCFNAFLMTNQPICLCWGITDVFQFVNDPLIYHHMNNHSLCLYDPFLVQAGASVGNISHMEAALQPRGAVSPSAQDEGDQLEELPFTPVHAPVITVGMNEHRWAPSILHCLLQAWAKKVSICINWSQTRSHFVLTSPSLSLIVNEKQGRTTSAILELASVVKHKLP